MSRPQTHASILSLPDLVNNDAALVRRGRYLPATNFYRIDGDPLHPQTEIDHFPMAENPAQFRRYLLPVLDEIRAAAR
jgi:hypothetical protein